MLGMTAPSIPKREAAVRTGGSREPAGTVQGRDVHLPVELQRRAGVIAVPGSSLPTHHDATPDPSTVPNRPSRPIRSALPHGSRDLISHGPWYEQEPAGADAVRRSKRNLIGRVAIGAAIAASLSVVLFAIVRVRRPECRTGGRCSAGATTGPAAGPGGRPTAPPPTARDAIPPALPGRIADGTGDLPSAAEPAGAPVGRPSPGSGPGSTARAHRGGDARAESTPPARRHGPAPPPGLGSGANRTEPRRQTCSGPRPWRQRADRPHRAAASGGVERHCHDARQSTAPVGRNAEPVPAQPSAARPSAAGEAPGAGTRTRGRENGRLRTRRCR